MPFRLGTTELIIILVIVVILFGVGRVARGPEDGPDQGDPGRAGVAESWDRHDVARGARVRGAGAAPEPAVTFHRAPSAVRGYVTRASASDGAGELRHGGAAYLSSRRPSISPEVLP